MSSLRAQPPEDESVRFPVGTPDVYYLIPYSSKSDLIRPNHYLICSNHDLDCFNHSHD